MSSEKLARCFEEYWSDKPAGTGLGLSTARRIIEEHGGTITALSEEGRGSSFSIYLPLAVELVRGEESEARAHEEGPRA
jgi:signal transduction histidine kinase